MARQDSNSELAGQLAASLTPRVDHVLTGPREAQNSGLFDVGALYAEAFAQVAQRARVQAQRLPLPRSAQATWPRAATLHEQPTLTERWIDLPLASGGEGVLKHRAAGVWGGSASP